MRELPEPPSAEEPTPQAAEEPRAPAPAPGRANVTKYAPEGELPPDAPVRGLGQRVRDPVYERLDDVVHALSKRRLRTSKTELLEMLLWELPVDERGLDQLATRLRRFQERHPTLGRRR
jgi:hypothetical protein